MERGNPPARGLPDDIRAFVDGIRPFLTRIPDLSIIVTDKVATSVPGEGRYRFAATRDEAGTYAMIYAPVGREFSVRTNVIKGKK